jgi:hypothetical protein
MEYTDNCDAVQAPLAQRVANLPEKRRARLSPWIDDPAQSRGDVRAMPILIWPQAREGVDNG